MIDTALLQIATSLNESLRRSLGVVEDLVSLASLHEPEGSLSSQATGRLSMFLVNIERDTLPTTTNRNTSAGRVALAPPPICLNLQVMFAACFDAGRHAEALRLIASVIGFFQSRPVLDHHNTPELDTRIDKLAFDIQNLSFAELANLWGLLGGKYMPSVLYRMRMVSIDAGTTYAEVARVAQPQVGVGVQ
ncbi:DUF4255 domain-containing protein [Rhizobacter sp. P5_C2]